jgi:Mn-containing catalase
MQYTIQGINCENPGIKDLLMDIGTEELSHLEVIGTLAMMHLKPTKGSREAAEADPLVAITGGGGVNLYNSQGNAWTADYLKITGVIDVDLRNNIAAEARAKVTYDNLLKLCDDAGTKDALQFLMTREITHMKAFMLGLDSLGKAPPMWARSRRHRAWWTSISTIPSARATTGRSTWSVRGTTRRRSNAWTTRRSTRSTCWSMVPAGHPSRRSTRRSSVERNTGVRRSIGQGIPVPWPFDAALESIVA